MGFYARKATNLFRYGQCDATTDWEVLGTGVSRAVDATTPPLFSLQSIKLTGDGSVASQGVAACSATGQAAATGTIGVGSVYFKGVEGQSYSARMMWVNTDASFTGGTSLGFTATGSWQLLTPESVAVAGGKTGNQIQVRVQISGTRAESFWIAHAMLEIDKSAVSSYVMTSGGTTKTRPVRFGNGHFYAPHMGR